jgi:hypothetical protein
MYKVTIQTFVNQELEDEEITFVETIEEGYVLHKEWSETPEIATGKSWLQILTNEFIMDSITNKGIHATFTCDPDVYDEHIMALN